MIMIEINYIILFINALYDFVAKKLSDFRTSALEFVTRTLQTGSSIKVARVKDRSRSN